MSYFNNLSKKQKFTGLILTVFILIGLGYLGYAIATGKIRIGAAGVYGQSVSGYVYDRDGQPLSGVTITNLKTKDYVKSTSNGYSISVPEGEVVLSYEKDGAYYPTGFSDIPSGFWAEKWIGDLKNAGIVGGYPDGTFHPAEEVTRAQMAVFLARALARGDANVKASGTQKYSDVPTSYWAYKYIDYLYNNTTIRGYPDGTFKPEDKVTRAQMAVFISKALSLDNYDKISPTFSDVAKTYWAYGQIEKLNYLGIAMGYGEGTFKPEVIVTRDQMSVFIARAFQEIKLTNGGYNPRFEHFKMSTGKNAALNIYLSKCGEIGRVSGYVKDTTGAKIANARVKITLQPSVDEVHSTTTDANGNYTIFNIPAGTYAYYITKPNSKTRYELSTWENIVYVGSGQTTNLNLTNLQ